MNYKDLIYLIYSDLYRTTGEKSTIQLLKNVFFGKAYKYSFWLRICSYTRKHQVLKFLIFPIAYLILRKYVFKFSISISHNVKISSGFYISHFGGIIVNPNCVIGKNLNISQGVTLGQVNRGKNKGSPIVGDNVYIASGAKVIGAITIGNNVAIGANCVVTKDIPDNAVVVGIPGKIISYEGSKGYVNNIDYDSFLKKKANNFLYENKEFL